jgi:hypothetical protein
LRDLSQQKIPRELCGVMWWGRSPLRFYVPMESFFDGTDQENSKTRGGKGQIKNKKFKKNRRKEWREIKRDFYTVEVPILVCSSSIGNTLRPCAILLQENPLIRESPLQSKSTPIT